MAAQTVGQVGGGALFDGALLLLTAFWWLPTMLAVWRRHPRVPLIATLNFLLMWPSGADLRHRRAVAP